MRPLSARDFGILGKIEMGVGCTYTYLGRVLLGGFSFFACFFLPGILGAKRPEGWFRWI